VSDHKPTPKVIRPIIEKEVKTLHAGPSHDPAKQPQKTEASDDTPRTTR
jgi:hypothetical protein